MIKKLIFIIGLILDIFFYVFLLIKYPIYSFVYIALNFILFCIFFRIYLNISIINIDKIKNIIKTNKLRKNISENEKYLEKMKIKTFDGSNGTTHPCIIYFKNGFNGYKYYMVHTPYDNNNVEFENPSLCVSNDGFNFIKHKDTKDPLLPIIKQHGKILKYYNDNWLLFDEDKLQIWYRYTEEDKTNKEPKLVNKIFRITSNDGINFSQPELMIDDDGIWYLSPSIVKINDLYYLYYFDKDLKLYLKTSKDLKNWSKEILIKIDKYKGNYWHGEVKLVDNKMYLLFLSKDYKLYLCETDINNPLCFKTCDELYFNYYDKCNIYGNTHPYKSTFLIDDEFINFYIPYKVTTINYFKINGIKHTKWTMTNTYLRLNNYKKYIKGRYNKNK